MLVTRMGVQLVGALSLMLALRATAFQVCLQERNPREGGAINAERIETLV